MTNHPSRARKDRGMSTQAEVARYLATHGWPFAESTGAARRGADVTGTVDIAVEVKARSNFEPLAWVRQATTNADGRQPFAVMRCNGQGPATIEQWVALIPFGDLVRILREAGYGDGAGAHNATLRAAIGRLDAVDHRPAMWPRPPDRLPDPAHNHVTRDIKPRGTCPACDAYHDRHDIRRYDPADILDDGQGA